MSVAPLATAVTPLAEARGLEVHFRRGGRTVRALDGVDLEWRRHEVLGVIGAAGGGKTTLARTLLGLEQPSGGELRFEGTPVDRAGVRTLRRGLQMVYEDPYASLDPRMRVSELVQEPLRMQGRPRNERVLRAASALEDAGLAPAERFWSRRPHELSGGQRQRVAIASALAARSRRARVRRAGPGARRVGARPAAAPAARPAPIARGLALLLITHDVGLAWALCDRIAVLYRGRVVELGQAADVLERPQHPYTQALVALSPSTRPRPARRAGILPGDEADAAPVPGGCRFHPRCPRARERCAEEDVGLRPTGAAGQTAACWYPGSEE